jgi:hypothetical protein
MIFYGYFINGFESMHILHSTPFLSDSTICTENGIKLSMIIGPTTLGFFY